MLALTTTRKNALRVITIVLTVLIGAGMAIALAMSSMTASAQGRKIPIYSVHRNDGKIALTFDCAWGNSNTDELLEILESENARATFFVTGEFCDKYPEDVRKMYEAGHEIANHSDKHPHISGMNINDLISDVNECGRKIEMITGKSPDLYRAPYGEYDDVSVETIEGMGYYFIQWSVDSIDWEEPSPDTIINRVTGKTTDGAILLFHNDLQNTTAALPEILSQLRSEGFEFVTAGELIYRENYSIDNSGNQIKELQTMSYTDNRYANEAFEIMRRNLSIEEIYALTQGADLALIEKIRPMLNSEQLTAIQSMSYDELKEAVWTLVESVESEIYGTEATEAPQIPPVASQTTPPTPDFPLENEIK